MRKKDYETLAGAIKSNFEKAENAREACGEEFISGWNEATLEIAVIFSDYASVDKEKFLLACGIKKD